MHYSGVTFVEDLYGEDRLVDILEKKIGLMDFPENEQYYDYYDFGNKNIWDDSFIKPVKDIYEYIPKALIIFSEDGKRIFFQHIGILLPTDIPNLNMRNMSDADWKRFVQSMYIIHVDKYAVLLDFHL